VVNLFVGRRYAASFFNKTKEEIFTIVLSMLNLYVSRAYILTIFLFLSLSNLEIRAFGWLLPSSSLSSSSRKSQNPQKTNISSKMSSNIDTAQNTNNQQATWCPEQQIYVGGTVPGEISEYDFQQFLNEANGSLPIFGYGSLCWNPGDGATLSKESEGVTRTFGRAVGWKRCWCQRSADHRGTPEFQGLVCTLLSDEEILDLTDNDISKPTMTEGILYTVPASLVDECLEELDFREKGGYSRDIIQVEISDEENIGKTKTIKALLYRGTPDNPAFWKRPLIDLSFAAATMSVSIGPSGPNDAYLYNLDTFLSSTEDDTSIPSSSIGDLDTKTLASRCREFQTKSLFFLYGCGSNQYEQLLLANGHPYHKYLLSDDNNVHELAESILTIPKLPVMKLPSSPPSTTSTETNQASETSQQSIQPLNLYAGGGHSALLLNNGNLYLWGWNEDGQLGRPTFVSPEKKNGEFNISSPVHALPDISVEKASLGHAHTLIIERNTGHLYGFGDNSRGQVTGDSITSCKKVDQPTTHDLLKGETFIEVAAGLFHSAGITTEGELITWGDGRHRQCLSNDTTVIKRWKPDDGSKLVKVVCGRRHTVVLDECGRIWTMGDNKYGQLGRKTLANEKSNNPQLADGLFSKKNSGCIDIACGWSHCLAVVHSPESSSTRLHGWGRNDKGQLGIATKKNIFKPTWIELKNEHEINAQKIDCGSESSMFWNSNDNSLWSTGWNEHGNLSHGNCTDIDEFRKIEGARMSPTNVGANGGKKVLFAVGGGHMHALMT